MPENTQNTLNPGAGTELTENKGVLFLHLGFDLFPGAWGGQTVWHLRHPPQQVDYVML